MRNLIKFSSEALPVIGDIILIIVPVVNREPLLFIDLISHVHNSGKTSVLPRNRYDYNWIINIY